MTRRLAPAAAILVALAAPCLAQNATKPAPQPAQPKATAGQPEPKWPRIVTKTLKAKDVRGKVAPEFVVEDVLTTKPDRTGKVVLIDFWATWCGPCRKAMPEIRELQQKYRADLVCIGVSDEPAATVRDFMHKNTMGYTVAVDTQNRMGNQVGVTAIPHVIVISSDGVVRWQGNPLEKGDSLADAVKQTIDADPAVQARRKQSKPTEKPAGDKPASPAPPTKGPETPAPKPGGG